ncbi:hypothetical protein B0J15DRAFT_453431 [Fusarium solani]|uniref:Zn(2)-C6 fungal-type domain-containing protein n=1 Tax=Fusarium solani TaxID=169388 RepID=A0A9P9GEA7_FUSSL|nr:uncharacterized protein B0J15DRAFT_453431 [Fusarium solani]KAH7237963.1 hypothetical protein B0J15DRAFT_453431 [Fusarium solani]
MQAVDWGGPPSMSNMLPDQTEALRNCIGCKERKVRCDRRLPCSNCTKAHRDCVFPTTGRILRQPQRTRPEPTTMTRRHLVDQIRRLEDMVGHLHARYNAKQTDQDEDCTNKETPTREDMDQAEGGSCTVAPSESGLDSPSVLRQYRLKPPGNLPEVGIMVHENRGRLYVGDRFWATLQQELDVIRDSLNGFNGEEEEGPDDVDSDYATSFQSSYRSTASSSSSFIFSNRSLSVVTPERLRPLPSQMLFIWQTYVENVDPFIKVLHVPTVSKMIYGSRGNFDLLPPFMEPLMFSIAFAAIKSLTTEEVQIHFHVDMKDLVSRFRLGTEESLARADFINTKELPVLQGFLIYIFLIRLEESQRYVWSLAGLISRVAVGIGLHRDGSHFPDITPFEAEMRRRVWCYICILDFVTGDYQLPEISIPDSIFDTRLPSNIDDDDIGPDMSVLPEAKSEYTDMTICLLRSKIWRVGKHFKNVTSSMYPRNREPDSDTLHKLAQLSEFNEKAFSEFLKPVQADRPIHIFTRTMASVSVRRYKLILHHIRQPSLRPTQSSLATDKAFIMALGILEDIYKLQHGPSTRRWAWQLYGLIQWQPLAIVLGRLSVVEFDAMAEHAWGVVTRVLSVLPDAIREEPLWQPLCKLSQHVKKSRFQQLMSRRGAAARVAHKQRDQTVSTQASSPKTVATDGNEGNAPSWVASNTLPGPGRAMLDHPLTGLPVTTQPALECHSQDQALTSGSDAASLLRGSDGISSILRRQEDHLPAWLWGTAPGPQVQDPTGASSHQAEDPIWDQWDEMVSADKHEQSMLWDGWAF